MAKVNIDLEKLVCSVIEGGFYSKPDVLKALLEQGIEYKDGSLHYIGEEEKKPDTIKFNEPDTKKYKFVDLDNPSAPIPITRISWKLYASSHSDSSHRHSEELLLFLLTKGYQRYQEELRQDQCIASQYKECPLSSTFEHDIKTLQEDLMYILDVNWNPECDYNYPKK